jgi:hypothetical protein
MAVRARIKTKRPSTLANIVMEVESLPENEKQQMLEAIRKRKAVLAAFKLDQKVKRNDLTMNEIVAEVKKARKQRYLDGRK